MANVLTVGTFDYLHDDHIALLDATADLVGMYSRFVVGVNTDEFVFRHKGVRPTFSLEQRIQSIETCYDVDIIFGNNEDSLYDHICVFQPDLLVVGSDWHSRDYLKQIGVSWPQLAALKCSIVYVPSLERVHSSDLRAKEQ